MNAMSPSRAILIGQCFVNGPVFALLFGPSLIVWQLSGAPAVISVVVGWRLLASFGISFALAWLWWSISVPRWRVWAYARVEDVAALKQLAVEARLTWPDGSIFERTELKSPALATREKELLGHRDRKVG